MVRQLRLATLTGVLALSVQAPGSGQTSDPGFELDLRAAVGSYWTVCDKNTLSPVAGVEAIWRFGWVATASAEIAFAKGRAPCGSFVSRSDVVGGVDVLTQEAVTSPRFPRSPRLGVGVGPHVRLPAGELTPAVRAGVTWVGYEMGDTPLESAAVPWISGALGFRPTGWTVGVEVEAGVHRLRSRRDRIVLSPLGQVIAEESEYLDPRLDPFVRLAVRWRFRPGR